MSIMERGKGNLGNKSQEMSPEENMKKENRSQKDNPDFQTGESVSLLPILAVNFIGTLGSVLYSHSWYFWLIGWEEMLSFTGWQVRYIQLFS